MSDGQGRETLLASGYPGDRLGCHGVGTSGLVLLAEPAEVGRQ